MKNRMIYVVVILFMLMTLSSCSSKTKTVGDLHKLPDNPTQVVADVEGKVQERKLYDRILIPISPVLLIAEARYGLVHFLYFQSEDDEYKNDFPEEGIRLVKILKDGKLYYMGIFKHEDDAFDRELSEKDIFSRKAYIGSRVNNGKAHQYTFDGKIYGEYVEKFDWQKLLTVEEYSMVEIERDIMPDSYEDKITAEYFEGLMEAIKNAPDGDEMFSEILRRVGKITNNDVLLLGATNFHSLYMIVGVRLFAVIDAVMNNADLSQPYYETATTTQLYLALALAPMYDQMEESKVRGAEYDRRAKEYDEYVIKQEELEEEYRDSLREYNKSLRSQKCN